MDDEYQEIRDFCVREWRVGNDVGFPQLAHHLKDCGYGGSTTYFKGLGQKVSATYRRLDEDDDEGRNALLGYFPDCDED